MSASHPQFRPGDLVGVIETHWNDKVMKTTGLYDRPGWPKFENFIDEDTEGGRVEAWRRRQENCIGTVKVGDACMVVAVVFCEDDNTWYYFLNNMKPKGTGWTRCADRLKKPEDFARGESP